MYKAVYNKSGQLAHSSECMKAFKRLDDNCPRCAELKNGAPARDGWQKRYYTEQARQSKEIREHDCIKSRCNAVCCTFGEW